MFTESQLKSENWSETYPTPDGRCGKVYDYVLNKVKTASAYASVQKVKGMNNTRVNTYGYISSNYYRDRDNEETVSAGHWTLDIWYAKDPLNNVEREFVADEYYSIAGDKKFWFKKPRDVKGKATAIICNDPDYTQEIVIDNYLASAWVDWPTEGEHFSDSEDGEENGEPPKIGRDPGLYNDDLDFSPEPGESITLNLVTDAPYSQVYWYVKAP